MIYQAHRFYDFLKSGLLYLNCYLCKKCSTIDAQRSTFPLNKENNVNRVGRRLARTLLQDAPYDALERVAADLRREVGERNADVRVVR